MGSTGWASRDWVAAGCGEIVKVWNPSDPRTEVKIYQGTAVYCVDFSHNNKVLAVAGDKGQIHLHSSQASEAGSQIVGTFPQVPEVGIEAFSSVVFALNGKYIAAGSTSGIVRVWDLKANGTLMSVNSIGLTGSVTSIAIAPSVDAFAATSSSGQVMLCDVKTGGKPRTLARASEAAAGSVCYNTAGSLLAYGNAAGTVALWDTERWERTRELVLHKAGVTGMAFSEANPELVFTCGRDGVLKCTDLRTRKDAWLVTSRQPYTTLSAKHDGQLVAVGNTAGCVLIHDVRGDVKTPVAVQQFNDSRVPVSVVRWQHHRPSRSTGTAASVTTSAVSSAAGGSVTAAAPRQQQQTQPSILQSQRRLATAAAAAPVASQAAGVGGAGAPPVGLRAPGQAAGQGNAGSVLEPEASNTSMSASMDFSMLRAFSPVQLDGDEAEVDDDAATSAPSRAPAPAPAQAAMRTPEMAVTPGDSSMLSAGYSAPFMFTPGIGLGLGGSTTPLGLTATADVTPISRPAAASGAAALAPAATAVPGPSTAVAPAPEQAAPAPGAAVTGRLSRRDSSSALDSRAAAAATSRASTPGRASLQSSVAAAGAAGGAAPGARSFTTRQNSSSSIMGATAAAAGSRPSSRAGSTAGSTASASAAGLGSRRSSSKGLQDAAETAAGTVDTAAAAAADIRGAGLSVGVRAADGVGSRPTTAGAAATASVRDEALKEYINQQFEELRADVHNMHLDMLKQFHQAQMDLVSVVDGLAQRQDQLAGAIGELTTAVQGIRGAKQLPGTGGLLGMMGWI